MAGAGSVCSPASPCAARLAAGCASRRTGDVLRITALRRLTPGGPRICSSAGSPASLPAASPARPSIPVAAWLVIVGAALVGLGSVLTWGTFPAEVEAFGIPRSFNGFTELEGESRDGPFFAVFAAILAGFGLTMLLAKRLVPILIIGMVLAGFGLVASVIDLVDVANPDSIVRAALDPDVGPGLPLVVGGFAVVLGGLVLGVSTGNQAK